ncbi:MAG: hypothetical protein L0241_15385 [Planctomycetia bacterium]|nr:hypothetical protein [Planctomycetia bacterium]
MRHEQIRELLQAKPFRPFTIHLPEGRAVPVTHHDFALVSPDGRTLVAYDQDGTMNIVDVMLIASIHLGPPPAPPTTPSSTIPTTNGPQ